MVSITTIALADTCQKTLPDSVLYPGNPDSVSETKYGFGHGRGGRKHKNRHSGDFCLSQQQTEQLSIGIFYVYTAVLALLTVALEHRSRKICNVHLIVLLLVALAIDSWVIVLPAVSFWVSLPTYNVFDWVMLGRTVILAFAAVIVPIYVQRAYITRDREAKSLRVNGSTIGRVLAKDLTARCSSEGPTVLKKINFTINAGERISVLGCDSNERRALALALLREIPTTGKVYLDGISTHTIAHEALCAHMTFISEEPGTAVGTLREVINPRHLYGDVTLQSTLRSLGIDMNLDFLVDELPGEQKARILLAKAIICRSKLVILDDGNEERTPAIRFAIESRLPQSTLLVLSTRLGTVRGADKVMILDSGRVVEFGPPGNLLRKWSGSFKAMVDASEERSQLYKTFSQ
ncbi:ABC transporter [Ceratobasidium sp. AG-Ba]|nr:ABC transporter [Ceratobasidium sp. AG-Ba]